MDFRGQTAVLSAIFVLVGMMFLVPAITEKALAAIHATAKVVCGTTWHGACELTLEGKTLNEGSRWTSEPTQSGTVVTWSTAGKPPFGDEKGSVTYNVASKIGGTAVLTFDNPVLGTNECSDKGNVYVFCKAGSGQSAEFTYTVHGDIRVR
jgi:hypothetical protein